MIMCILLATISFVNCKISFVDVLARIIFILLAKTSLVNFKISFVYVLTKIICMCIAETYVVNLKIRPALRANGVQIAKSAYGAPP